MTCLPRHIIRHATLAALALPIFCATALGLPAAAEAKSAKAMPTLRVMLNPAAAPRGMLPDVARDRLTALAGAPVALVGTTRTGARRPYERHRRARERRQTVTSHVGEHAAGCRRRVQHDAQRRHGLGRLRLGGRRQAEGRRAENGQCQRRERGVANDVTGQTGHRGSPRGQTALEYPHETSNSGTTRTPRQGRSRRPGRRRASARGRQPDANVIL